MANMGRHRKLFFLFFVSAARGHIPHDNATLIARHSRPAYPQHFSVALDYLWNDTKWSERCPALGESSEDVPRVAGLTLGPLPAINLPGWPATEDQASKRPAAPVRTAWHRQNTAGILGFQAARCPHQPAWDSHSPHPAESTIERIGCKPLLSTSPLVITRLAPAH